MRFRKHISEEYGLRQLDIAPLIDVVFILLIFFMLTSNFIVESGIRIDLPKAVSSQTLGKSRVTITVSSDDLAYLNGKYISDKNLKKFLLSQKDKVSSVFIKSDRRASLGRIVRIWDICKSSGMNHINIATFNEKD